MTPPKLNLEVGVGGVVSMEVYVKCRASAHQGVKQVFIVANCRQCTATYNLPVLIHECHILA